MCSCAHAYTHKHMLKITPLIPEGKAPSQMQHWAIPGSQRQGQEVGFSFRTTAGLTPRLMAKGFSSLPQNHRTSQVGREAQVQLLAPQGTTQKSNHMSESVVQILYLLLVQHRDRMVHISLGHRRMSFCSCSTHMESIPAHSFQAPTTPFLREERSQK